MLLIFACTIILSLANPILTTNWMERHWSAISNRTLQQITLPGTHDSGSFNLTDQLEGPPEWLDEIVLVADALGLPVGKVIDGWAQSQTTNFLGQFSAGIRYLDLRIIYDPLTKEWRTHHGIVLGSSMKILFADMLGFINANPKEVIVLELSHSNSVSQQIENQLLDQIQAALGSRLWPPSGGWVPLDTMISQKKPILLTLSFNNLPSNIWNQNTIVNSYANSDQLAQMEEYNDAQVQMWQKHGIYPNGLFKMSWTLTPNVKTILGMLIPGHPHTLLELADIANPQLPKWFKKHASNPYPILGNILIIDDCLKSQIVGVVTAGL